MTIKTSQHKPADAVVDRNRQIRYEALTASMAGQQEHVQLFLRALQEIYDRKLWDGDYKSWEEFCESELNGSAKDIKAFLRLNKLWQ